MDIVRDITGDRKVEEEIHRSQQMLRLILDHIPQRVYWKDRNSQYLGCNKLFAQDAGKSHPREVVGSNDFAMSWGEHAETYRADDRQVMETNQPKLMFEERQCKPDGTRSWLRTSKVPLHDREGEVIGVLGVYEDITEEMRAEEALRASEEKYRKFFDEDLSGVYISSPEGELLACNPTFLRIFGFSSLEEALDRNMALLYPNPTDRESVLRQLREQKKLEHLESELRRKDGRPVYLVESIFGVFDERGELLEIKGYIFDDTSRKKLEEQFLQSQRIEAVGRLAGGIAHDFNNLLTCINGYSELLLTNLGEDDPQREFAEEIHSAGEKATKLIRQLLAFSRRQLLRPEHLDLNDIVNDMQRMLQRLIGEDIHLSMILDPQIGKVKADPTQIEQVIMNLALNSRDALSEGGRLSIQTANVDVDEEFVQEHEGARPGPHVMLAVSDNGCGVCPEARAHLFEPFYTTKELGKGTGLGLSTVYGIVKQSDGYICVESEVGLGSTFAIYLPRVEGEPSPEVVKTTSAERATGAETVLLAEDEESVLELARRLLRLQGYRVLTAPGGPSALQLCREHSSSIDLLITDVVMPVMGGQELARKAQALRPEIKVLFMSGYSEEAVLRQGHPRRNAAFLQKPFSATSLTEKVREVLGSSVV